MSTILFFALFPVMLFAVTIAWLLAATCRSFGSWALQTSAAFSIAAFAFLAGPWALSSYHLRYAMLGLFLIALLLSLFRAKKHRGAGARRDTAINIVSVALLVVFTSLNALAVVTRVYPSASLPIAFPLSSGTYYVLQGGSSIVTNLFHVLSGEKSALDIVELTRYGNRANGIAPDRLSDYAIFGRNVYSPCAGTIMIASDGLPDNHPGTTNSAHPSGNHIVVRCSGADILLAHLQENSIGVLREETVVVGQPIGKVGNSGNSLEPHLHIGARNGNEQITLRFDNKTLSINSVVIRHDDA